tara:strand:+ start:1261 stop:1911 length:651 start_codon:yes stop_codon:yes gene_type:complete
MSERGKVHLNMIVTKTGDQGQTYLNDGSRVSKASARIKALALLERISVQLGFFIHECDPSLLRLPLPDERECQIDLSQLANSFQQEMYDLGSDLCTPLKPDESLTRFPAEKVEELTALIAELTPILEPLDSFILPQGSLRVLISHEIRTIVRQAEIQVWEISEEINPAVPQYLNRLSDFWFVLGRILQSEENPDGEIRKWEPNQKHARGVQIQNAK